nr:hypothetical protein [Alteribacter natronophilus]
MAGRRLYFCPDCQK